MAADSREMKMMNSIRQHCMTLACLVLLAFASLWPQHGYAVDPFADYGMAMYERPALPAAQSEVTFPPGLLKLWTKALQRPEVELQRMVIDSMALAHRQGLPDVGELRPDLRKILRAPDQSLDLVRAAANALIALESRNDADLLAEVAVRHGGTVAQIVEPALATWKSNVMKEVWLERVRSRVSSSLSMVMAIEGLGKIGASEARDALAEIVKQPRAPASVRMASAQVLARLDSSGLVELAQLIRSGSSESNPLPAVLAIELLSAQNGADSVAMLEDLLDHPSHAVQSGALAQLLRIDPELVDSHIDRFADSSDAGIRTTCARSMIATKKVQRIEQLAAILDDENPSLRREVSTALVNLASVAQLKEEVIQRVSDVLNQDSWRGCEQASVVLAKLDYDPAGPRMVELLAHDRGEVKVAAAWGLTQLKIEELLPAMLAHAQGVNDLAPAVREQVAHLFIAMGDQRYAAAVPLMREYLPKNFTIGTNARAAAAWALGLVYEDDPQADLVNIMLERLNDTRSVEPELSEVRRMCAVSLGRMKAEAALPVLRENGGTEAPASHASDWAIQRMTGEPMPVFPPRQTEIGGWFLSPIPETSY